MAAIINLNIFGLINVVMTYVKNPNYLNNNKDAMSTSISPHLLKRKENLQKAILRWHPNQEMSIIFAFVQLLFRIQTFISLITQN